MSTKSCEYDAIPTKLLNKCLTGLLPLITKVINASLENGKFISHWKEAIIRPLLKKPGLELVTSNYRPVILSKVLVQCCLVQFNAHCSRYKLLPDYQSAYRENYSCETALIKLTDDFLNAMEHQKVTALVAIDLSAAFDTVDHSILLSVLSKKFGVAGSALKWFETYLYPRACKVNVGNSYSEVKDLKFSVPQGSCCGPFLYLAYASTIQEFVPNDMSAWLC